MMNVISWEINFKYGYKMLQMGDVLLPRLITDGQILHLYANLQAVPSHHETLRASHQRLKDTPPVVDQWI